MPFLLKSELFLKGTDMATDSYNIYCKIRDKLGYKDSTVAAGAGVTKSTFSDWKAGRYQPKDEKLQKIASFLGVSVEYLKKGEDSNPETPYYLNDDAKEMAQFMFENPEYKVLFDASRKISKEDIETVKAIMDKFKMPDAD